MNTTLHFIKHLFLLSVVLLPAAVFAQSNCVGSINAAQGCAQNNAAQGLRFSLVSPLDPSINSIEALLVAILNILIIISIPIIVFFVIYAGFMYVTAQGNQEKVKTATRSLTYAVIGAVLILGAVALTQIIRNIIASFG